MTDNEIGTRGKKALSEMLKVNSALTSLILGGKEQNRK